MKKKTARPLKKSLPTSTDRNAPRPPSLGAHGDAALFDQAIAQHQAGNFGAARVLYEKLLSANDHHVDALSNFGMLCLQCGRLQEGMQFIEKSLKLFPSQPIAYMNLGSALHSLRRLDEALECCDRAVALRPDLFQAHFTRGNVLNELLRTEEALASYDRAIALKPDYVQAYFNRGNTLKGLGRLNESLASYDRAIAIKPDYAEAYYNRGYVLNDLKRIDQALANCDRVVALMPNFAEAHYNRGNALHELGRFDEAVASYDHAIALKPNYPEAFSNRGNALRKLKRLQDALASYERAIVLNPAYASAYNNLGNVLLDLNRYDAAMESYGQAISIDPGLPYVLGSWLHSKMCCCDWADLNAAYANIISAVECGDKASYPFFFLATPSSLEQQETCAQTYIHDKYPESAVQLWQGEKYSHDRIRIGYLSADFYNHATAHLMAELFELHDHSEFEIIGISFGPITDDAWQQRVVKSFDRYFEVKDKTAQEIAALVRELEIDIAIDLKGHTKDARTGVFALRPAPLQVNYLGYPGTMGADYYEYIIADPTLITQEHRRYYSEKIIYLPNSYQVNDSSKVISDRVFTRAELNLPDDAFVFCCFNNNYKITPDLFEIWMRLLHRVDGSVLWLLGGSGAAVDNLHIEAERAGVSPDRLVFGSYMELPDHLARHRQADLFLDTFYYNAHTTASDALWAGLPVLTCLGVTFAGRAAASLLNAVGLPEMITHSRAEYESLAIEFATKPELLSAIRQKLAMHRSTQPLYDTPQFARHIEAAYKKIYARHQAGLAPEHSYVEA